MTALNSYSTGTVAVSADGTTVTGTSTLWLNTGNVKPGDLFQSGHFCATITDVTDDTHLTITPWPGSALSGATYKIWKVSQQRIVGETYARDVDKAVSAWNTSGFFVFVDINQTVPDPSLGDDGQYAFQPTTGKTWAKVAGIWSYLGIYKAFQLKGAWSGATAYTVNDVVTLSGSSYACVLDHTNHTPPNATYWQLLASIGATGNTGPTGAGYGGTSTTSLAIGTGSKVFTTQAGLAYTNGARVRASSAANTANWMEGVVTYSGTTLTMTSDKTGGSGTLADWNLNVAGQPGAGDLLSTNNGSDFANAQTTRGNLGILSPPQGRLTLVSGTPVMTTSQASKTTLYYALYVGNQAPVYDGTKFTMKAFTELSAVTTDTTKSPAAIGASKVNDWFLWDDAGTMRISHGPDWTNDTTRAAGTALVNVNGTWLNNASITNGPAAQRGTYLGTTRSDASSQLNWVYGAPGTAALLNVWNAYNRVPATSTVSASASNWSYTSATVRQANASAACQISFISGLAEEPVNVDLSTQANMPTNAGSFCQMGFAMDSTSTFDVYRDPVGIAASTICMPACPIKSYGPQLGYHFVSQNEAGDGTFSTLFFGNTKSSFRLQTRM